MTANKFVAIYYFNDTRNYDSNLKSFFKKQDIELSYETNFCKLLSKILVIHPMMVVIDHIPNDFMAQFLDLFQLESPYYVPSVCFLQDDVPFGCRLPYNCTMCGGVNYESVLLNKIHECMLFKHNPQNAFNFPITRFDVIMKILRNMCINVKSSGSIFLKDCINQVIIDGCKACTLYGSVYSTVAAMHGTSVNNLERCMRTSINNAWKVYNAGNCEFARKLYNEIFVTKPTVKELIYYVANYVKDKECENKMQWLVNGINQKIAL